MHRTHKRHEPVRGKSEQKLSDSNVARSNQRIWLYPSPSRRKSPETLSYHGTDAFEYIQFLIIKFDILSNLREKGAMICREFVGIPNLPIIADCVKIDNVRG